jgi:TatD DNase family protein
MLIDTHCHVQFRSFKDDYEAVIKKCLDRGMILNLVGTQKETSRWGVEMAEKYNNVYASIGTHPLHLHPTHVDEEETHFMSREEGFDWDYYSELAKSKKVIGVGECGLELFHLPKDKTKEEVLKKQKKVFLDHVRFSVEHELPLVVHCREAHNELIELLKSEFLNLKSEINGTIHCFTSNWDHAQKYLDMGFYLGFTGVVTFPPKKTNPQPQLDLEEVIKKIPLERIVVETDSPYLAPQAYRGTRSEPWMVEEVVKKFAKVRQKSVSEMEQIIAKNSLKLFRNISI